MSWYSIREFTQRYNLSTSTIRRHIQQGKIAAKKFGRNWYIEYPEKVEVSDGRAPTPIGFSETTLAPMLEAEPQGNVQSIVDFSSKALNHYLMMHEKLMEEKELRLVEKESQLTEKKQEVAELEGYVRILEEEIKRLKDRPEGWS